MSERLPAFIPHDAEDDPIMDGLGFWAWGALEGEWSGNTTWLADAPLPEGVPEAMRRPLKSPPGLVADVKAAAAAGELHSARLLAPVVSGCCAVLPVDGSDYDVNPNYVAHIARTIPGGSWALTGAIPCRDSRGERDDPVLVWVVDGEARAVIALAVREARDV